ncbi:MAG: glycosyltransferase, partial [Halobacteriales archaeon]|nr:glycosyltransferase [Halobacteriales archaeon]
MGDRESVSVLLPTIEWNRACDQLSDQIQSGDELLVICDTEDDPVASHDPPDGVEILLAGEPEGCSGKANAMAYGMEQATNDRFVWTDADFDREDDWLDRLVAAGEQHGPATS